jgi:hypothetical protein
MNLYDFGNRPNSLQITNAQLLNPSSVSENAAVLSIKNEETDVDENICVYQMFIISPGQYTISFYTIIAELTPLPVVNFLYTRIYKF